MAKRKGKGKTGPQVIVCPAWCERGDEHVTPEDTEHWTSDRPASYVGGIGDLSVSAVQDGGCILYEIRLGDYAKVTLQDDDAAALISGLAKLLADTQHTWKKRVELSA